ncbi:MAG: RNA methyltransferase [bacterium]|nr:RNA methyltransferase [bacterium]
MPEFVCINSRDNEKIKEVVRISSSPKHRKTSGLFVLEGLRLCIDAYRNGYKIEKVFITDEVSKNPLVIELASSVNSCFKISADLFNKISDTKSPQGILCVCRIPTQQPQFNLKGRYIALENIQDPSNLGAIARTAEAFGLSGIIISDSGCDPFSPKVMRASMGALLRIPVFNFSDFADSLQKLSDEGMSIYATVVDGFDACVSDVDFCPGTVVIMGNEANGVSDVVRGIAKQKITLPMTGRAESLNVAAAAAIFIWEMTR